MDRLKYLWRRVIAKSRGAAHILAKFSELNKRIYIYGSTKKMQMEMKEEL